MIGLYLITTQPSVYRRQDFGPAEALIRMRRARGNDNGRVHLTTSMQPKAGAQVALCGAYPSPIRGGGLHTCDRRYSKPWQWTDDDIDCQKCLTLIVEKFETGTLVFATPKQAGELLNSLTRVHPVPGLAPLTARERALSAGIKPGKRIGALGHPSGNGAAEMAADAAAAYSDRDVAALALAELSPGEHYPTCDLSGEVSREDWTDGGLCSCYGDEFLA